jgi:hypothetical protein
MVKKCYFTKNVFYTVSCAPPLTTCTSTPATVNAWPYKDWIRNELIGDRVGVALIEKKLAQHRLRWFGRIQRRPPEARVTSRILKGRKNTRGRGDQS